MILRQLLPGLKNTRNRLLIAEAVLPSRLSEQVNHREIEDLTLDLNMFTLFGAHERTEEQSRLSCIVRIQGYASKNVGGPA